MHGLGHAPLDGWQWAQTAFGSWKGPELDLRQSLSPKEPIAHVQGLDKPECTCAEQCQALMLKHATAQPAQSLNGCCQRRASVKKNLFLIPPTKSLGRFRLVQVLKESLG